MVSVLLLLVISGRPDFDGLNPDPNRSENWDRTPGELPLLQRVPLQCTLFTLLSNIGIQVQALLSDFSMRRFVRRCRECDR